MSSWLLRETTALLDFVLGIQGYRAALQVVAD